MLPLFPNNYEENCTIYTVTLDNKAAYTSQKKEEAKDFV